MRFQWTLVLALILLSACGSTPVDIPSATSTASPFGPAEPVDQRFDTASPHSAATQGGPVAVTRTASPPQPRWTRSNPGGGGAFVSVGGGPTGIILAGRDLSGAHISSDFMQDVAV